MQLRGDAARELRRVHERFAPVAPGLTLARLAERAISVGLSLALDEMLTAARELGLAGLARRARCCQPGSRHRSWATVG